MKNEYAYTSENKIIHISEIQQGNKSQYTCINCGSILIPKKGKIRSHHFSHKHETNCSYESYLHKLGKLKFYDQYKKTFSRLMEYLEEVKALPGSRGIPQHSLGVVARFHSLRALCHIYVLKERELRSMLQYKEQQQTS